MRLLLWLLVFVIPLLGCSSVKPAVTEQPPFSAEHDRPLITIGAKAFTTEQMLYEKITALYLRKQGYPVKEMVFRDSLPIRKALESGVIDLYWEYTNTARIFYHHQPPIQDAAEAYRVVSEEDKKSGFIWLKPSLFYSPWVVLMKKELSEKLGIDTISQLAEYSRKTGVALKAASYEEFLQRKDGLQRMEDVYGLSIKQENWFQTENSLVFQAVKESRVQVGVGIAYDGRINEYNLAVLADDRHAFPPYQAAPVIREPILTANPSLEGLLNRVGNALTEEQLTQLAYQVDVLHKDIAQVVQTFLVQEILPEGIAP